jgi:hypothetical protein
MLNGRIMLFDEYRNVLKKKLWHCSGIVPAVL